MVVDSSVIVKWLSSHNEKWLDKSDLVLKHAEEGVLEIKAPTLAKYEVANVIRYKSLSVAEKLITLERFCDLPIEYFDLDENQAETTMSISLSCDIAYYDAAFLELAQRLNQPLVTADAKDQGKYTGSQVIELKDYR